MCMHLYAHDNTNHENYLNILNTLNTDFKSKIGHVGFMNHETV